LAAKVSEIAKGIEEQVAVLRTRPVAAPYDKVRMEDQLVSLALMTTQGVNKTGDWEALAVETMFDETGDS
jgi:transposase-like protein